VTLQKGAAIQYLGSWNQISKSMGCGQAGLIAPIHQSVVETLCSAKYLLPLYYDHIYILSLHWLLVCGFGTPDFFESLWILGQYVLDLDFGLISHSTTRECGFSHTNSCSS
jgi:hypothetical protein